MKKAILIIVLGLLLSGSAYAISQGNQQVADELRAQRNQQSGQYLMDLGQKLLNPPTSKRTTRCTVYGTGSFKTVSCR